MLNLAEELFLLALDDDEGWIVASALDTLRYGLAAALLADLALHDKIAVEEQRIVVRDLQPLGDELLDDTLKRLADSAKPRKVKFWLNALGFRKLPKQIAQRLAAQGVLVEGERRVAWAIPSAGAPQPDAPAKYWIKQSLRTAGLLHARPERRAVVLLSLMQGCRLLNLVFTRDERKAASKRVDELVRGEDFGAAVAQTLADIEAATTAAVAAA
jgi:hypothetical protein